jgi:predicted DNA binding protein
MLKEVRIAFQHDDCWMIDTTRRHPEAILVVSGVYQSGKTVQADVVLHAPKKAILTAVEAEWGKDPRIKKLTRLHEGPRGVRFHVAYASQRSIYPHIVRFAPLTVGSISVAGGEERIHLMGTSKDVDVILNQMNGVGKARVESIRNREGIPPDAPPVYGMAVPDPDSRSPLTDRQMEALELAFAAGYYQWPRKSSATDIAHAIGITTTAFLQQLRKAEILAMGEFIGKLNERNPERLAAARARLRKKQPESRAKAPE